MATSKEYREMSDEQLGTELNSDAEGALQVAFPGVDRKARRPEQPEEAAAVRSPGSARSVANANSRPPKADPYDSAKSRGFTEEIYKSRQFHAEDPGLELLLVLLDGVAVRVLVGPAGDQERKQQPDGHDSPHRSSSLARSTASRIAAASGPSRSTSRDELGSTAATARRSADVGDGRRPARRSPARGSAVEGEVLARVSPMVAPTTAPNEPSGSAPSLSSAQVVEHPAGDGPAVRGARVLDLRALLVGGEGEHEQTGVVAARGVDHRVERAEAEVRAGRDRVGGERRGRVEVGVGVRLRGRADVAALDVEQHQRAGRAGLGDDPLEHRDRRGCRTARRTPTAA